MADLNDSADANAIFAPLWKRKWLILIVGLIAGALTYGYYKHQDPIYGSSTGIYLGSGSELQALLGEGADATGKDRSIANQVVLINSSVVAVAVQKKLLREGHVDAARGSAGAESSEGRDFILISSQAGSGEAAAILANTYAQVYLDLREESYRRNVQAALESTRQQLRTTEANASSAELQTLQVQSLADQINHLESQLSLGDAGDRQINPAVASPEALSPKPTRNAIFGFVLGIVLASLVTYALSRFDRRLRSLSDIEATFQAPVLAAVPSIRRPIDYAEGCPVPANALREPLRRLHTTLQLRSMSDDIDQRPAPRTVLFVSADAGEGKSTLIAGLGLVQAEAGERVAIVESDLRRPIQAELLGVDGSHGLAEGLGGELTVQEATQAVRVVPTTAATETARLEGIATRAEPRLTGSISVLPSGGTVANPQALLAGRAMPMLLRSMAEEYDYLLVDAPPPLEVSDVLPVLALVDAVVLVARVGHTGETSAQRLVQLLSRAPHGPVLGIIANDASASDMEAFGFSLLDGAGSGPAIRRG